MMRVAVAMVPEVRQLLQEDPSQLAALLEEIHEEDLADLLTLLDDAEAVQVLKSLKAEDAAPVFERLDEETQEALVEEMGVEQIAPIVSEMAADDRTDLIEALPEPVGDTLLETLEKVDPEAAAEVEELARWPEDSAGGLMTTDYISVRLDLQVADVIERIRAVGEDAETVYYVYVVDSSHRLLGVVSLRDLLLASPAEQLSEVLTENVFSVGPETDQEEVARAMAKYDFLAMPVLSEERRLLGVITVDDVMDVLTQEQTEDVQRLGAVEPIEESYFRTGFWTFIQKRAIWLAVLFVGEFFTGSALRRYDEVIAAVSSLSYYVPLLISTGGNSGSQSSTLIIRGLAMGDIRPGDWWRVLPRELAQGLVLGLILATIGMARVWAWGDSPAFIVTIGATLVAIVLMGCVVGAMLPLLLRRVGLDPATSSAPFIASLVDVLGIIVYFSLAQALLADVIKAAVQHQGG
ncbi:magnesium transporter [Chondromyces crocatus]|uniref:Magnesium transporter MgtE n=1 Tax=Chondromyces crocatus TaxID=52 RepID=A0A0K1E548_CHOCO|nr:magnesium transporter [Chondromyces crocatus]AKT36005.1 magnesium transporter [Chondromyces crocatus]